MATPVYKPTAQGMVAVTPDGQIIQAGTYSYDWTNPVPYKIYQGPGGRLFRSYNPGIHGHNARYAVGEDMPGARANLYETAQPESYRWEWSPDSDRAIWNNAQTAFAKIQGKAAAKPGGGGAATNAVDGTTAAGGGAGGTTTTPFDYDKWLANEPTLQAALANINAAGLTNKTQLVGGEQQLFGRLGEAPDLSSPQFAALAPELQQRLREAVTPELQGVIDQSNQAGTSALARLNFDYRLGQSQDVNRLAGQGILRSGAYGQESNKNLRDLTLGQYDKRQTALDTLGGLQSSYLTGQRDLAGQAGTAVASAQERAGTLIGLGQLGPVTTTAPTATNPVGNPYMPPTTAAPKPAAVPKPAVSPAAPKAAPYKTPSLGFKALR